MKRIYRLLWFIIWPFFSIFHLCRIQGKENLPENGGLFCANHCGLNDPLCIILALDSRYQLHAMAKAEFMNIPVLGALLKKAGMFGVSRGKSDVAAIKTAMRYLKSGENVLMFPEGTRIKNGVDKYGRESDAKSGAIMLAVRTGAPVVPVYVPTKKRMFRPVTIVVGEPYYPTISSKQSANEEYKVLADDLMRRIYSLGAGSV